jgi:hypothetical protein
MRTQARNSLRITSTVRQVVITHNALGATRRRAALACNSRFM